MHNDLTTVEPPMSVTAVSIADYNSVSGPLVSDLLVGFLSIMLKVWEISVEK